MSEDKRVVLVNKLLRNTIRGVVKWEESADPEQYMTSIRNTTVAILKKPLDTKFPSHGICVRLLDDYGTPIEEFHAGMLSGSINDDYFDLMEELFDKARGYAKGTEQALDKLISALDEECPPEETPQYQGLVPDDDSVPF